MRFYLLTALFLSFSTLANQNNVIDIIHAGGTSNKITFKIKNPCSKLDPDQECGFLVKDITENGKSLKGSIKNTYLFKRQNSQNKSIIEFELTRAPGKYFYYVDAGYSYYSLGMPRSKKTPLTKSILIKAPTPPPPPKSVTANITKGKAFKINIDRSANKESDYFSLEYRENNGGWNFFSSHMPFHKNKNTKITISENYEDIQHIEEGILHHELGMVSSIRAEMVQPFSYGNSYEFKACAYNEHDQVSDTCTISNTLAIVRNSKPNYINIENSQLSTPKVVGKPITFNIIAKDPDTKDPDKNEKLTVRLIITPDHHKLPPIRTIEAHEAVGGDEHAYVAQWTPEKVGQYQYYATVTDDEGAYLSTDRVPLTVSDRSAPTVVLSISDERDEYVIGQEVTFDYTATSVDSTLSSVELMIDGSETPLVTEALSGQSAEGTLSYVLDRTDATFVARVTQEHSPKEAQGRAVINLNIVPDTPPNNPSTLRLRASHQGPELPKESGYYHLKGARQAVLDWVNDGRANRHRVDCEALDANAQCPPLTCEFIDETASDNDKKAHCSHWVVNNSATQHLEFARDGRYQLRIRACYKHESDEYCQTASNASLVLKVTNELPSAPRLTVKTDDGESHDSITEASTENTLQATASSSGSYTLTWRSTSGGIGETYLLEEKMGALDTDTPWYSFGETANTEFHIRQQTPGRYSYRLKTCIKVNNKNRCSADEDAGSALTMEVLPPVVRRAELTSSNQLQLISVGLAQQARVRLIHLGDNNLTHSFTVSGSNLSTLSVDAQQTLSLPLSFPWVNAYNHQGIAVEITNPNGAHTRYVASKANDNRSEIDTTVGTTVSKDGSRLYVTSGRNIRALNIHDGTLIPETQWGFKALGDIVSKPIVDSHNGHLIVGTTDAHFYKIASGNGSEMWHYRTHDDIVSSPINHWDKSVSKTHTYVGDIGGHLYRFSLDDQKEQLDWIYPAQSPIRQTPVLSENTVYVATEDGQIHAIGRGKLGPNVLHWSSKSDSSLAKTLQTSEWKPDPSNRHHYLRIATLYELLLRPDRPFYKDVLSYWSFTLSHGASLDEAAAAFLEVMPRLTRMDDSTFVDALYDRAWPDGHQRTLRLPQGDLNRDQLVSLLEQGAPRSQIATYFTDTLLRDGGEHNRFRLEILYYFGVLYDSNYRDLAFTCDIGDVYERDCDGDGLKDWWELLHFQDLRETPEGDADKDGTPNIVEWREGSSPCDGQCLRPVVAESIAPASMPTLDDSTLATTDSSSATAGQFRVNEAGAATYSMPISLPPGVAGVAPTLSLNYSSQAGNGLLGRGWSLGGLSAIRRCRQTLSQDGAAKPITWTSEDRFCFNGQRLLLTSGEYGHPNSTYATEIKSFTKVTAKGGKAGHPDYFIAEKKDGSLSYFGRNSGSNGSQQQSSAGQALVWSLSRFEDSVGNGIEYQYANDGGHRLTAIEYAFTEKGTGQGRQGGTAQAKVTLDYSHSRKDAMDGYTGGEHFLTTARLQTVQVFSAAPGKELEELRTWTLSYPEYNQGLDRISVLESVQESHGGTLLPLTQFSWTEFAQGESGIGFGDSSRELDLINNKYESAIDYQPADINGDGRMDLVWLKPQNASDENRIIWHDIQYTLAKGNGFGPVQNVGGDKRGAVDQGDAKYPSKIAILDYNADGRSDVAYYDLGTWNGSIPKGGYKGPAAEWVVFLSEPSGNGWKLSDQAIRTGIEERMTRFMDINSDGLVDAISLKQYQLLERDPSQESSSPHPYHFGEKSVLLTKGSPTQPSQIPEPIRAKNTHRRYLSPNTGDFDGDGRMDFVIYHTVETRHERTGLLSSMVSTASLALFRGDHFEVVGKPLFEVTQDRDSFGGRDFHSDDSRGGDIESRHSHIRDKIFTADFNGDGLTDIITATFEEEKKREHGPKKGEKYKQYTYSYRFGTGNLTEGSPLTEPETLGTFTDEDQPQFVDYNLDGATDLVYRDGQELMVRRWFGGQLSPAFSIKGRLSDDDSPMLLDMSGDGRLDLLVFHSKQKGENLEQTLRSYTAIQDGDPLNVITSINNGLGAETHIHYGTLADSPHYARREMPTDSQERCEPILDQEPRQLTPFNAQYEQFEAQSIDDNTRCYDKVFAKADDFYSALNSDWQYDAPMDELGLEATPHSLGKFQPVLELMAPIQVVTLVSSTAPAANEDSAGDVDTTHHSAISYYYEQAQVQAAGRGMLGFQRLRTVDEQTKVETSTTYRQDFPFTGYPLYTETRTEDGQLLSRSGSEWRLRGWDEDMPQAAANDGVQSLGSLQPYLAKTVEETYDLADDDLLLKSVTTTNGQPDNHGNTRYVKVVTQDHTNDDTFTTITNSDFGNGKITFDNTDHSLSDYRALGRLTSTTVTHQRTGATSETRTSSFTYYDSASDVGQPGQLKTETVEPDNIALAMTTTYEYDAWGNQVSVSQSGHDWAEGDTQGDELTRTSSQSFDDTGRYPVASTNAYGQVTERIVSRNAYGAPLEVKDINGVASKFVYTPMGFAALEYNASGAWTQSQRRAADEFCPYTGFGYLMSVQLQAGIDGGASQEGSMAAFECFDRLGRSVRTGARTFDGGWALSDTEYDTIGRVKRRSEPFAWGAEPEFWTEMTYDLLGRVVSTQMPGIEKPATASYAGFDVTHTNPKLHQKTERRNALGELALVTDHKGSTLTYQYDAQGNLEDVITQGADGYQSTVSMSYDTLGRKITLDDPDKGSWQYRYNAFGELRWQQDAKQQVTELRYDSLGRKIWRENRHANGGVESQAIWTFNNEHSGEGLGALVKVEDTTSKYSQSFTYDELGRADETHTHLPTRTLLTEGLKAQGFSRQHLSHHHARAFGDEHFEKVTYDQFGRQHQTFDASGDGTWASQGIQQVYNDFGFLQRIQDAQISNGTALATYYKVEEMNLRGQVTSEQHGDNVISERTYEPATGRLKTQQSFKIGSNMPIQNQTYEWDDVGNLTDRHDESGGDLANNNRWKKDVSESFTYDALNRLETATTNGETVTLTYDDLGNIRSKTGVGSYRYGDECDTSGTAGIHAVCSTDNGKVRYTYDANGNLTSDSRHGNLGGRSITYSTFDKPVSIVRGRHHTRFAYGPSRNRYLRADFTGYKSKVTRYFGGVEKISHDDGRVEIKRYVGNALITLKAENDASLKEKVKQPVDLSAVQYLLKDHLGSTDIITNRFGNVTQAMSFDAWGARRNGFSWTAMDIAQRLNFDTTKNTTRGFTGHEMLDEVGLVHMNGRIYDARIGRFVQADIFVDGVTNTQGYNRYSYLHNNPLNATDPSGFLSGELFQAAFVVAVSIATYGAATAYFATTGLVCSISGSMVAATLSGAAAGFMGGVAGAALSGQSIGDIFEAGVQGALSGAIFSMIGLSHFGKYDSAVRPLVHGLVGGITNELKGGKFGHGFLSAGLTKALNVNDIIGTAPELAPVRILTAALIGGTISEATGGKFANGAVTAALAQMLNGENQAEEEDSREDKNSKISAIKREIGFLSNMSNKEFANRFSMSGLTGDPWLAKFTLIQSLKLDLANLTNSGATSSISSTATDTGGVIAGTFLENAAHSMKGWLGNITSVVGNGMVAYFGEIKTIFTLSDAAQVYGDPKDYTYSPFYTCETFCDYEFHKK